MVVACPICGKSVPWSEQSPFRPFCSKRCQLIDLGEWASGDRAIPAEEESPSESDDLD
ncbi:DNA gyrase inhibitor YacG [Gallaecimonas xiamenensis]|uniref:DNA gyrase inhibitor YacG n=1 Tax=Gallaecimonas xiamenensis 3-C-1 TaxID=745411 RepID=K2JLL4_9GAMM|nr:DNA gyrase inhibitor YacG [Gallaecimonas xiamenensis]EKE71429.1 dephospho-CoA kinase [Gallaecimonas xiamenensis 3-C-1]